MIIILKPTEEEKNPLHAVTTAITKMPLQIHAYVLKNVLTHT